MSVIFLVLISAVAWSLMDVARKYLAQSIGAIALSFWLVAGVTPIYGAWWFTSQELPEPGYWLPAILSMGLAAIASVAFINAVKVGHLGKLIPILALTPVIAGLGGQWLIADQLHWQHWLAIIAIVIAIFLLNGGTECRRQPGLFLMLIVAFCWGAGTVLDRWALESATPIFHGFIQSAGIAILLLPIAFLRHESLLVGRRQLGLLLFTTAIFIVAVAGQWFALQELQAGVLEALKRGVGILGALLWSFLFFQQGVNRSQFFLCVVIIAASTILALI